MGRPTKQGLALAVLDGVPRESLGPVHRRSIPKWRALSLTLVYLAFAAHIIHWRINGTTLAPLELNEVMYTLELGIITAGFIFMCFVVAGTLIFGRFFCSWACHIIALQDLCAWLLRKIGLRPRPVRSRLLLFVPPLTAIYMFVWPQIVRAWENRALPTFHFATDADGWASFTTTNFWRNLPGPWVIAITFLVCGFMIVYLLGSRTFCTYVCPYGAIFGLVDRVSPGRILVNDSCEQCGRCTAICTSGVRVHEEIARHGMVVNSACMKDLDCVSVCPQDALRYGFAKPAAWHKGKQGGRFGLAYDYTPLEEVAIAVMFIGGTLALRGLYGRVPFLLALALAAIVAVLSITTVRLFVRSNVKIPAFQLKSIGRMSVAGWWYATGTAALVLLVAHSGWVRYHEYVGLKNAQAFTFASTIPQRDAYAKDAVNYLTTAHRWGLLSNARLEQAIVPCALQINQLDVAQRHASRYLTEYPHDLDMNLSLGNVYAAGDQFTEAEQRFRFVVSFAGPNASTSRRTSAAYLELGKMRLEQSAREDAISMFRLAVQFDAASSVAFAELGTTLADRGDFEEAISFFREALRIDPGLARVGYNLGTILAHLGRWEEAVEAYGTAQPDESEDPDLLSNFGYALSRLGRFEQAQAHLLRAVDLDPRHAGAHFNLGVVLTQSGETAEANEHLQQAARIDARYAEWLRRPKKIMATTTQSTSTP